MDAKAPDAAATTGTFVYERIIDLFEAEGINTMFGIPDPGVIHMASAAEKRGWNVVAPRHEQGGSFMAEGWSRLTGKPGIMFGTQGPGIANLAAAMIVADKENMPIIFIGGNRDRFAEQRVKRGRIQYISQVDRFRPNVKYAGVIEYAEQTDEVIREALRRCQSGRPGPVYIEIPAHVMLKKVDFPPPAPPTAYRLVHQPAGQALIDEAVKYIKAAKNPIILMGHGVFTSRSAEAVGKLAELMACPLVRTTGTDAHIAGHEDKTFSYGFTPAGRAAVVESDCCLAIGTELGEPLHYGAGRHWEKNNSIRKWILIERDPDAIGVNRSVHVPLVGDIRDIVPQLIEALKGSPRKPSAEFQGWIKMHADYKKELVEKAPKSGKQIHSARFVIEATKNLPKDIVFVRDGGAISIFGWTYPQTAWLDMVWNQNLGHLGTGLGYALGAQIAVGNKRRVMLLTSDSTFLFHTTELETAVRKNLPVVTVVGVDYQWGLEVGAFTNMKMPLTEVTWTKNVRFDKLAESFGAHGEFVQKEEDIQPAVQRAFASGKPAVVHVEIDPVANSTEVPGYEEFVSWYADLGVKFY
jgi:thiamine pyrophosphate-dependent acetolactate synthase large subunit-like protein